MSSWSELTLSAALRIKHGYAFPGTGFGIDPATPQVLTPGNFALNGGFQRAKPKSFAGEYPAEFLLSSGEVVVTMTDLSKAGDTLGFAAQLPPGQSFLHNQRIGLVEILDETMIDARFFQYLTRTVGYRSHILGTASGSTVKHTSPGRIGEYRTTVPSVPEQQAIAEVLGALDDKIAANTNLAATARELGVAMLRIDGPTTALGDVVAHHKQQINPLTMDATIVEHYSLPAFDSGSGPEIVDPGSIKSSKFSVHGPAVLVSKLNPQTPRVWPVLPDGSAPRLASTEFLVLEPRVTSPWVMWALLSQPNYARSLQAMVAGTSGSHQRVRPDDVLAAPILDPRAIPQQLLADVGEVLAPIDVLSQENRTLAATRDALLPQLMSGKLRVRDAERIAEDAGA